MKCNNCGAGNSANDKYCAFCGAKIEAPAENVIESSAAEQAWNEPTTIKKNRGPVIAVVSVLILILGLGGLFGYRYYEGIQMTPEERLTLGIYDLLKAESGQIHSVIAIESFDLDAGSSEMTMLEDLLKNLAIDVVTTYDVDAVQAEMALKVEMAGTSLVTIDLYMDKEQLMVDLPLFYNKALYIHWDDLIEMTQGPLIENVMYGGYGLDPIEEEEALINADVYREAAEMLVGVLDKDQYDTYSAIDPSPYKALIAAYFVEVVHRIDEGTFEVDGVSLQGTSYHLVYDAKESQYLSEDLIEEMSRDESVIRFLEEVITRLVTKAIDEENYVLYAVLMEKAVEETTLWDSTYTAELEAKRLELIQEMKDGLNNAKYEMQGALEDAAYQTGGELETVLGKTQVTIDYHMDQEDRLRSQETLLTFDLSQFGDSMDQGVISIVNDYKDMDGQVSFVGVDVNNSVDLGKLSEEELMVLIEDIQNNVMENVMTNPVLSDWFMLGY